MRTAKRWSKEDIDIIYKYYGKIPFHLFKDKLPNRTSKAILNKAVKLGIPRRTVCKSNRKYTYNDHFFSDVTNDKCYWAGFIAADGYINKIKNNLVINLSRLDKQHLENLKNSVEYTGRLRDFVIEQKNGKISDMSQLQVCGCRNIIKDLNEKYNITTKKSLTLEPPNLKDDQALAFIIGYIDGDGSICYRSRDNHLIIGLVGTFNVLNWIRDTFNSVIPPKKGGSSILKTGNCYKLNIEGKRAELLYSTLSGIDCPRLNRKWNK